MDCNTIKQYYYLIQLALILYLSCAAGDSFEPSVQMSPNQDQQRHHVSSLLLTNGYVPIIISKPVTSPRNEDDVSGTTAGGGDIEEKHEGDIRRISDNAFSNLNFSATSIKNNSLALNLHKNASETIVPSLKRKNLTSDGSISRTILVKPSNTVSQKLSSTGAISSSPTSFNVLDVVGSLDLRLKHIRNIELGVTYIQEIFDAMGFTNVHPTEATVIHLASKIRSKLDAVNDILDSLSEFIGTNITLALKQKDVEASNGVPNVFLNTLIQPCPFDDFTLEQNYNKKQIQILNYLKISGFRDLDDLNFTINTQILNALRKMASPSIANTSPLSEEPPEVLPSQFGIPTSEPVTPKPSQPKTKASSNFKHVFFLSKNDHASDHNCQYYFNDLNFRHFYASAIRKKHVFLVVDTGNSLTAEQLDLSKQFVSNIIQMLSDEDTITVVVVDDQAQALQIPSAEKKTQNRTDTSLDQTFQYNGTMEVKEELLRLIGLLHPSKQTTNHSLAFQYSLELIRKQNISEGTPLTFVYVSRGLLNRFTEAMTVLETLARGQAFLRKPIVVNTCAVVLDEKRIMYEKQFLHDIAQQNYSKYNINVSNWFIPQVHRIRGNMYVITKRHPELIVKVSTAIFSTYFKPKYVSSETKYHLPVLDYNTKDVIVAVTKPIPQFGIVGINMFLNDLAEDIIYYHKSDDSYAFLVDKNGMVIYHPAFSRPVATVRTPYPVSIELLEPALMWPRSMSVSIWKRILDLPLGNETVYRSPDSSEGQAKLTYVWHWVLDTYIVCLVTIVRAEYKSTSPWKTHSSTRIPVQNTVETHEFERYQHHMEPTPIFDLLYHRIDLIPPPKTPVCRHFRQIATLDTGTIFLSASAFKSPFTYFKNNREMKDETQKTHSAQSIMAYIKDITNLLANPGLQVQIRNDVSALLHVMSYLKKRHLENSALKKYIIRRYVATTNGVLQVYPGCILGTDLEPSRRPWFRKAVKHPGRIAVTEPYLDAGGAGHIITIAHTLFEGKANALHNAEKDAPIAVVALDVPYAFFYKLLLEMTPLCSETKIKCLLMEDEGYLLAHPSMMEPSTPTLNSRRPTEHITHKESFVANDILNHKVLVKKKACATFQSRIIHRYYEFNTSLTQVLTNNVVHGERTKYQITAVPGTNIFTAILNSTCDGGAFCPCSTVDRVCLNCNRMDQADCECPCECALKVSYAANDKFTQNSSISYCEPETEGLNVVNSLSYDWNLVVKSCVNINCEMYTTHVECLGVMGCEWCQLDVDINPFSAPFCTSQNSCFNGILGSTTPYGDGDLGSAIIEPSTAPAYSAIGPVGGTIIALCLMVGFAMYCYRQNLDSGTEHLYGGDSMQEENFGVPLSRLYFDDILHHDDNDLNGNGGVGGGNMMHRNLLHPLANALVANDISPYHMSPGGYRRPANGESDHGYSTMTPHEDSEHMCFTLVEPLISNNHKRLSMSADSMSVNTSVSSPINHPHNSSYYQIPIDRPPPSTPSNLSSKTTPNPPVVPTLVTIQSNQMLKTEPSPSPTGQTILPNTGSDHNLSHHILAPVTVHRHMEAS